MAIVGKKRPAAGADGGGAPADKLKKPRFEKPAVDGGHKKQFAKPKFSKPGGGAGGGGGGPHKFGKSPSSKFGAGKKPFNKFAGKSRAAPDAAAAAAPVKQDWSKFKKEKKELKLKRKQGKDLFELTVEGKKLYEKLKWFVFFTF